MIGVVVFALLWGCANSDCVYSDYLDVVAFSPDGSAWVSAATGGLGACDNEVERSEVTLNPGEDASVETTVWDIGADVSGPPSGFSAAFTGGEWVCESCRFEVDDSSGSAAVVIETGGDVAETMRISLDDESGVVVASTEI
jgi:hypothetical protein